MKHKIAVLSDSHNRVRDKVKELLKDCELILHAGDVCKPEVLEEIRSLGDAFVVRGNCDRELEELPKELLIERYGKKIYLVHRKMDISDLVEEADIVIFGHSHKYLEEEKDGKFYLNPGSCGSPRFGRPVSMALLTIDDETGEMDVEKIDLRETERKSLGRADLVEKTVNELKKSRSVEDIVSKYGEDELIREIAQIYYTHPGVTIDGILNRMDIKDL